MKVVKPQKLGLLTRVWERNRKHHFTVTVMAMAPFGSPTRLFPEPAMWQFATAALGDSPILDEGFPKQRGELLVSGKAFVVGGPKPESRVRVKLGALEKTLRVVGDRFWAFDASASKPAAQPTAPVPFEVMPIDWGHAYGGEGFAKNPLGKGAWRAKKPDGTPVPLPNVEDPRAPVTRPDAEHEPVGLGAYEIMWPQRFAMVGTHDEAWLKEQFPGFALDMDLAIFNTAPLDQQATGFFEGDEAFEVEGMHPTKDKTTGELPGLVARAFVTLRTPRGEELREIAMRLDTVRLFPETERALVVYRGVIEVLEEDADDVVHLMIGAERIADARKPVSYYEQVLANRLDKKKGAAYALRDKDLVPDPAEDAPKVEGPYEDHLADLYKQEMLTQQAMGRRRANELEKARAAVREAGLDPAAWAIEEAPAIEQIPEDPVERAEYVEKKTAEAIALKDKGLADARAMCERAGVDYDAAVAKGREESGGPPPFSADGELSRIRNMVELARIGGFTTPELEAQASDPRLEAKLRGIEAQLLAGYRGFAHHMPPAKAAPSDRSRAVREDVGKRPAPSFARRDLTGVDLAGLDLSGLDFTEALLERAVLDGCKCLKTIFTGAVLTRASLVDANLDGAELTRANLGGADLVRTSLRGAVLVRAIFADAKLDAAVLDDAELDDADFASANLRGASFARAHGARLTFSGKRYANVVFDDAQLPRIRFLDCSLDDVSFARARLEKATFMTVTGTRVVFDDARVEGLRMIQRCDFGGASFKRAIVRRGNLRETILEGADFEGADLSNADLSKAKLAGANLDHAVAREARFDRADLTGAKITSVDGMLASLQKAVICGADLRGSSFFGGDFLRVVVDTGTHLEGTLLERVRYVARHDRSSGGT